MRLIWSYWLYELLSLKSFLTRCELFSLCEEAKSCIPIAIPIRPGIKIAISILYMARLLHHADTIRMSNEITCPNQLLNPHLVVDNGRKVQLDLSCVIF